MKSKKKQCFLLTANTYSSCNKKKFTKMHGFYLRNTFISSARLRLKKNQENAKHHPKGELLLFENYSHSSSTLSSKNKRAYSKK